MCHVLNFWCRTDCHHPRTRTVSGIFFISHGFTKSFPQVKKTCVVKKLLNVRVKPL